jgi:1-phosphatidylinositol phosphodiesterase
MGQTIDVEDLPKSVYRLDWMRRVKSSLPVSLVSIPATHDAGTALGRTGLTRCQVLTIPAQLAVGVRGFDIRLRLVGSELKIYHSEESQKVDFRSVLQAFASFLAAHPSELLVMRVREESKAIDASESFEAAFSRETSAFKNLIYQPASRTDIPTIGQLRGKVLLLDNYGKLQDAVDYPNPSMNVQDDYDTSDMAKKFAEIVASFEDARKQKDGKVWDVNYTSSCTIQVDQLANARGVNEKVLGYLKGKRGNLGLVLLNFPSVDVVESIIASNF